MKNSMFVRLLLDSSGAMLGARSLTIKGTNDYLDTLPLDATVTTSRFATPYGVKRIHTNVKPDRAKITDADYPCIGGTPLYDAIGTSIQEIDTEAKEYDRVVFVIQTDGQETGESKEFTLASIKQLLSDKQDGEGWLVVFLGANVAAMQQAAMMGVTAANSVIYSTANSEAAFRSLGRSSQAYAVSSSRAEGRQQAAFTVEERNKIK